jgi:ribosomal protein S18 acetylase RimI-like enzyme
MPVSLRPALQEDEAFMFQLYAATRADEMALVNWNAEQKQAFLQMQYHAQRQGYGMEFPEAQYQIILHDHTVIGRVIVNRTKDEILLMDVALLPEYRNAGIGTSLIRDLQAEGAKTGKPLRLHVETFNRAIHLYEDLGFSKIGQNGIYFEMEWRPSGESEAGND